MYHVPQGLLWELKSTSLESLLFDPSFAFGGLKRKSLLPITVTQTWGSTGMYFTNCFFSQIDTLSRMTWFPDF